MHSKPISSPSPSIHKQEHLQAQRLIMTAQMQQALHLLELPLQELESFIEEQVVLNPILEIDDNKRFEEEIIDTEEVISGENDRCINEDDIFNKLDDDWHDYFESRSTLSTHSNEDKKLRTFLEQSLYRKPNLYEKLIEQANMTFEKLYERGLAKILIGYIDENGFLKTPLIEICSLHHYPYHDVERVLRIIQTFEPNGVGASSLQESFLIQLRNLKKEHSLAYQIIYNYYDSFLHNQIPFIQKKLKCSLQEIQEAIALIAKLDFHPGSHFSSQSEIAILPDVSIRQEKENLFIEVEETFPQLRINLRYLKMLYNPAVSNETKNFIKHHLLSARWLERNLHYRQTTIERIVQVLIEKQKEFFAQPDGKLMPLTMKTVADELNLHESTIARTVSNKYLNCSRGLILLRTFFTYPCDSVAGESLSSATVKQAILDLIEGENKEDPLSDKKISSLLKQKGIQCARRTVTKHRLALKKGNRQQRKKFGKQ